MIEVRTQAQLDKALKKTNGGKKELVVCVGDGHFVLPPSSRVSGRGSCSIVGWENCSIEGWENCSIEGWENCSIVGWENCSIEGWENCSIVGRGNCSIVGWGNCSIVDWGNCSIEGWGNCSIVGWGNCSIVGRENCSIVGWGNCSIVGWGNCSIRAWSAYGSIKAAKQVVVMQHNPEAKISGGRVLEMPRQETGAEWCELYGVEVRKGGGLSRKLAGQDVAILFKALGENFTAQRGVTYAPGSAPEASDWDGGSKECGGGLHFSPHPKMAKEFNRGATKFVACPVLVSEIVVHPDGQYPQKVKAPRVCAPCWEVDAQGDRVEESAA